MSACLKELKGLDIHAIGMVFMTEMNEFIQVYV